MFFLIHHHTPNAFAFVHEVECVVDFRERHGVGDQAVDVDLALHVPVDDLGHVGASACTAEGRAFPHTARHKLERTRRDFLSGSRHADDDALAPTSVRAFERLAHGVNIADAFEGEIRATAGQIHDRLHNLVATDFIGIDEMRHAEFLRHLGFGGIEIDADDLVGTHHSRTLDDVEADAAQAEHGHIGAGPNFCGVNDCADPGGDT